MVLTDDGWQDSANKQSLIDDYGPDVIEDEVNAPKPQTTEHND